MAHVIDFVGIRSVMTHLKDITFHHCMIVKAVCLMGDGRSILRVSPFPKETLIYSPPSRCMRMV